MTESKSKYSNIRALHSYNLFTSSYREERFLRYEKLGFVVEDGNPHIRLRKRNVIHGQLSLASQPKLGSW